MKLLIVEDNLADAIKLERILIKSDQKISYDIVESIAEAKVKISNIGYDVVLLDLGLPDSSELDGITQIKALIKYVPIICVTGTENEELGYAAIRAGAQDFLSKSCLSEKTLFPAIFFSIERCRGMKEHNEMLETIRNLYDDLATYDKKETILSISKTLNKDFKQPLTIISMAHAKMKTILNNNNLTELDHSSLTDYLILIEKSLARIKGDLNRYMSSSFAEEIYPE